MEIIENSIEDTLDNFSAYAGAVPLVDIFMCNSSSESLQAIGLPCWKRLMPSSEDILIAGALPNTLNIVLALRKLGQGLALLIAQGTVRDLLNHHKDILLEPPVSYTRSADYRDIALDCCPDCNARLLTTIESREHGITGKPEEFVEEMYINFFGSSNKAGSEETGFLLNILQQVQSQSSKISPFTRNR